MVFGLFRELLASLWNASDGAGEQDPSDALRSASSSITDNATVVAAAAACAAASIAHGKVFACNAMPFAPDVAVSCAESFGATDESRVSMAGCARNFRE